MRSFLNGLSPALLSLVSLLFIGCQVGQPPLSQTTVSTSGLSTLYDYQLFAPNKQSLNLAQAAAQLADYDVVMVGELHGHQGIHRFQADMFAQLLKQDRPWVLAMEQFSRDHQTDVDSYLAGTLGEDLFIKQANAWPSYKSDYRSLLMLAKDAHASVIAANAPQAIVRCIGNLGPEYLQSLPARERRWVAKRLTLSDDDYKARFMANRHHGQAPTEAQFAAQTSWDDTMAESVNNYLAQHAGHGIMLTLGRFHINEGLGTAARLQQRNPKLKVALIYPVLVDEEMPEPLKNHGENPPSSWTLKIKALPPSRLNDEPLPAFSLGEPDCPFTETGN